MSPFSVLAEKIEAFREVVHTISAIATQMASDLSKQRAKPPPPDFHCYFYLPGVKKAGGFRPRLFRF
jgi:hypothetical protein